MTLEDKVSIVPQIQQLPVRLRVTFSEKSSEFDETFNWFWSMIFEALKRL